LKQIFYIFRNNILHLSNFESISTVIFVHFLTKTNDIHSFKLIQYINTMKIAKNKKDEYVNKLTTSMLTA